MRELVELAMEAYGGLDHWRQVQQVSATFQPSGPSLKLRGPVGEAFTQAPTRIEVNTRKQWVSFEPFLTSGQRAVYEPHRTAVESSEGVVLEELDHPREDLKKLVPGTSWNAPQLIYFAGYSLWMYLTLPFSFLMAGVELEEAESWVEDGETWRALKVTYPDSFPSHSKEQIHYFDAKGIMRRQDYTVDVRQDLKAAHYLLDHQEFDGFLFSTKRRICLRGEDRKPLWDKPLISADLSDFKIIRAAL
jgi:hypothetical protein